MGKKRSLVLAAFFGFFFLLLVLRLFRMQVLAGARFEELSRQKRTVQRIVPAERGRIFFADGTPAAVNEVSFDVAVRIGELELTALRLAEVREILRLDGEMREEAKRRAVATLAESEALVEVLAGLFGRPRPQVALDLYAALEQVARGWEYPVTPLTVMGNVDRQAWTRLKIALEDEYRPSALPGVVCTASSRRVYPQGKLAGHVVGYLGPLTAEEVGQLRRSGRVLSRFAPRQSWWEKRRETLPAAAQAELASGLAATWEELVWVDVVCSRLRQLAPSRRHCLLELTELTPLGEWLEDAEPMILREGEYLWVSGGKHLPDSLIGRSGVERSYNHELRPKAGYQFCLRTADGLVPQAGFGPGLEYYRNSRPEAGADLVLTIAPKLQAAAERELAGTGHPGAAVVLDCQTGAVLALASWPGFDPNVFIPPRPEEAARLLEDPSSPLLNRAIAGCYDQGSCFKVVTSMAILECGKFSPQSAYECHGVVRLGSWEFICQHRQAHGAMSVRSALCYSCNLFFEQLGAQAGLEPLRQWGRRCGYGEKTGVDLPGERAGFLGDPDWLAQTRPGERWTIGRTFHLCIGQSVMNATPLQAARMMCVVASGGYLPTPHVVRRADGAVPPRRKLPLAGDTLATIRAGLQDVVRRGTARGAFFGPGVPPTPVPVAGKTSTVQNAQGEDHGWFVGYAPADQPRIAFAVLVENGGSGGECAAPIARELVRAHFSPVAGETSAVAPSPATARSP